ncbi:MAG: SAM-dependent methyltransferase [Bacteroidetes bacterium]|nr:SAM-dependent methyltransferase [Bacteroidota bacterium]
MNENNRIENKASHTALMAVIHRFLATYDNRIKDKGPDNLAFVFLPPKARFFLRFAFFRTVITKKLQKKVPGSYEYITARTNFFDEIFISAAKSSIDQIVFLGAGFDTRAIRFQHLTSGSIIFELDTSTTQNVKINYLKKSKIHLPENIVYVPINFNKDNLKQTLLSHGYLPQKRSLFIWEGVTMYITNESVKKTLSFIKDNSGYSSMIAFDYFYDSVIKGTSDSFGAKELSESARKIGEEFKFGIEEGLVDEFLKENGFILINHYTPQEFEKKFLRRAGRNTLGNMYGFAGHVYAKLKG